MLHQLAILGGLLAGGLGVASLETQESDTRPVFTDSMRQSIRDGCRNSPNFRAMPDRLALRVCSCVVEGVESDVPPAEWQAYMNETLGMRLDGLTDRRDPATDRLFEIAPHLSQVIHICISRSFQPM